MPTGNTQQVINYGASANDGQGDPLRTAFIKTDDNFDNIWLAGPAGSNVRITNNTIGVIDTNGNLILSPNGVGVIQTNNTLVPRLNRTYDLGSANLQYRTVYANAISAQLLALSELTVNTIRSDDSSFVTIQDGLNVTSDIEAYGNITADYFVGNGRQLTGLPASYGNSNVTVLLGNLGSNVINGTGNITTTGNISGGFILGNISLANGFPATYSNANVANYLPIFSGNISAGNVSASGNVTGAYVKGNGSALTNLPAPTVTQDITSNGAMSIMTYDGVLKYVSYATVEPSSGNITGGNISAIGNITAGNLNSPTLNNSGNISVVASGNAWKFDNTGNLVLPSGGVVYETGIPFGGLEGNTIALKPSGGIDADQQLLIYPTVIPGTDDNHLHLTTGNLYNTELFLGNDTLYVKLANTGNIVVNSNDDVGNSAQWTFGTTGNLTLPGNIFAVNYANGTAVSLGGNYGNANVAANLAAFGSNPINTTGNVTVGNLISSTGIVGNIELIMGNVANASATRTRILSDGAFSYIQTGNGTAGTTGNIVFSPYQSPTQRVVIDTASGNVTATGNVTAQNFTGNISITGNVQGTTANVTLVAGSYSTVFDNTGVATFPGNISTAGNFVGNGAALTNVAIRTTGTWTAATGTNTYSITVPINGTYQLWVRGNIPNGILVYQATVSVTNTNVPVLGTQRAWNYTAAGSPISLTTMPTQIIGVEDTISTATVSTTTANVFDFVISNTSGSPQTIFWGYVTL